MYEIESNIPLPSEAAGKYPFEKLEVGQSFLVRVDDVSADPTVELIATRRSIGVSMGRAAKNLGRAFEQRTVEGGVRVWRTA